MNQSAPPLIQAKLSHSVCAHFRLLILLNLCTYFSRLFSLILTMRRSARKVFTTCYFPPSMCPTFKLWAHQQLRCPWVTRLHACPQRGLPSLPLPRMEHSGSRWALILHSVPAPSFSAFPLPVSTGASQQEALDKKGSCPFPPRASECLSTMFKNPHFYLGGSSAQVSKTHLWAIGDEKQNPVPLNRHMQRALPGPFSL